MFAPRAKERVSLKGAGGRVGSNRADVADVIMRISGVNVVLSDRLALCQSLPQTIRMVLVV